MSNKLSYIGVKGIICDGQKVLITQEPLTFKGGGKWELPGGKIAVGEEQVPLEDILLREVQEELGDNLKVSVNELVDIIRRPWSKPGCESNLVFLATFHCTYISGDISLSHENHAFAWVTRDTFEDFEFVDGYLPVLKRFFDKI